MGLTSGARGGSVSCNGYIAIIRGMLLFCQKMAFMCSAVQWWCCEETYYIDGLALSLFPLKKHFYWVLGFGRVLGFCCA